MRRSSTPSRAPWPCPSAPAARPASRSRSACRSPSTRSSTDVEAYAKNAHITTSVGGVTVSATTAAAPPFSSSAVTAANLDDVAKSDDTVADWNGDAVIRQAIVTMFAAHGITLATSDSISTAARYTTDDGTKSLKRGDLIRDLSTGDAYRFLGADDTSVDLGTVVFTGPNWVLELPIRVSTLVAGSSWTVVDGNGVAYDVRKDDQRGDHRLAGDDQRRRRRRRARGRDRRDGRSGDRRCGRRRDQLGHRHDERVPRRQRHPQRRPGLRHQHERLRHLRRRRRRSRSRSVAAGRPASASRSASRSRATSSAPTATERPTRSR